VSDSEDQVLWPSNREDLARAYSPSSCVADIQPFLDRYAAESQRVRDSLSFQTHRYGTGPRAELDIFDAGEQQVHAFVHGGYWQQLSKADASFPAEDFVARGVTYIAVGYDLCPQVRLRDVVNAVRAALRWIVSRFPHASITLSGSSAGAHLAACVAEPGEIDRLVLLSGIYDLRPLVETYVNDLVGLDAAEAANLSPLLSPPPGVRTRVVWGENETDAFKLQSRRYAAHVGGTTHEVAARNHFDIVHDLFDISETAATGERLRGTGTKSSREHAPSGSNQTASRSRAPVSDDG